MSESKPIRVDVLVVGAGPVGALVASLVAGAGVSVAVVEAGEPSVIAKPGTDGRAIALALSAKRAFEVGGLWSHLAEFAEPILDIRVTDGRAPVYLHYDHSDVGDDPFGWIIENEMIKAAALTRLAQLAIPVFARSTVTQWDWGQNGVVARLNDGTEIRAALVVAADGRPSPTREAARIGVTGWDYGQSAMVFAMGHEKPHQGIAHEHFMASGPFAILPMTDDDLGHRSGIVWTEKRHLVPAIMAQDDAQFLAELQERVGGFLGKLRLAGPRFAYPLTLQMANDYVGARLALVGDAAHGMHPIAGQGLNLGVRDAAALAEVIVETRRLGLDVGSAQALERYRRWRRFDTVLMMGVTDSLNKLFSNNLAPVAWARDLGLWAVQHLPPAKRLFTRHAMGVVGDLPRALRGERI